MQYRFGDFELNIDARELRGTEGPIHLEPQVHDVLVHLIENNDRVVSKEELFDEVWGDRFVSESALSSRIKALRSALGDSGRAQHTIKTSHGTGYRFVAELAHSGAATTSAPDPNGAAPVPVAPGAGHETIRRLPTTGDRFRGRERELDELADLLSREQLITVLGPGGTGKTRLSIELAEGLPSDRPVVFVDLAAVRDDHALGQALAAALNVDLGVHTDIVDACTGYLRSSPMLLIVDNCEHVVSAASTLVTRILADAESTTVLATSRRPLGVRGETIFRLFPLPVPADPADCTPETAMENPAVGLFVDRVMRVQHDYRFDDAAVPDAVALCEALDGLPLAIELAAGRMSTFSLEDLLARLDRRLDLLGDDRTGTDDRHRSLRATLDWSYELLDEQCRTLFRHLSVFPSGHVLEGIEWLGGELDLADEPLLTLNRLVEASLVGRTETPSGVRYVQLETMRTFGADLLRSADEYGAAMDLAARWALRITDEMEQTLRSEREHHWNDRIRREVPNIREARIHLRSQDRVEDLVRISMDLGEWGRLRDVSELWEWADELMTLDGLEPGLQASVHAIAAQAGWRRGRIQNALDLGVAAAEHAEDDWTRANGLSAAGVAALFTGDLTKAAEWWDRRADVDGYFMDRANAALCRAYRGDLEGSLPTVEKAVADAAASGWPSAVSWAQYIRGEVASVAGEPEAVDWLEKAVAGASEIGAAFTFGVAGLTLCTATEAQGRTADAARRYADLIAHWLRSGGWTQQWTTLRNAARLLVDHDPVLALSIYRMADDDPYAPGLEQSARDAEMELRASVESDLSEDEQTMADGLVANRAQLAELARTSLLQLAAAAAA